MYSHRRDYGYRSPPHSDPKAGLDRQTAFQRFMSLTRPWVVKGGSMLDVEEMMLHLGLPTSRDSWNSLGRHEIDTALALAELYQSLAWCAFDQFPLATPGQNQDVNQIGPYLMSEPSLLDAGMQLPLQVAITTGQWVATPIVSVFFAGTHAYSSWLNGTHNIATTNAAVRAAGLLRENEDAIEVGRHRVVIRKEFFEFLSGDYPGGPNQGVWRGGVEARNSIPWVDGIFVNALGGVAVVENIVGGPLLGAVEDTLATWGTGSAKVAQVTSENVAGARITLYDVEGALPGAGDAILFANGATADHIGLVGAANVTWLNAAGGEPDPLNPAPIEIKSYDPLHPTKPPAFGGQYPNFDDQDGPAGDLLAPEVDALIRPLMGGTVTDGELQRSFGREQLHGRASTGLKMLTALLTHISRGHVQDIGGGVLDVTAFGGKTIFEILADQGLPSDAVQVVGYTKAGTVAITGTATDFTLNEIVTSVVHPTRKARVVRIDGPNNRLGLRGVVGRFASGETIKGRSSGTTAVLSGDVQWDLPAGMTAHTGSSRRTPLAGFATALETGQEAGPQATTGAAPIQERLPRMAQLALNYSRLFEVAIGGVSAGTTLLDSILALSAPDQEGARHLVPGLRHVNDARHEFATTVAGLLAEINLQNQRDPVRFPHTTQTLVDLFGWPAEWISVQPSAVNAVVYPNTGPLPQASSLLGIDPHQHARIITEAMMVLSGYDFGYAFLPDSFELGGSFRSRPGAMRLRKAVALEYGDRTATLDMEINVPATVTTYIPTGAFVLIAPRGTRITAVSFEQTPQVSASAIDVETGGLLSLSPNGAREVRITFNDTGNVTPMLPSGQRVTFLTLTMVTEDVPAQGGDSIRGPIVAYRQHAPFLDGGAVDRTNLFSYHGVRLRTALS